jgi:hypothetical protein
MHAACPVGLAGLGVHDTDDVVLSMMVSLWLV